MINYKAFLFDFDGVIVDSSDAHFKAWQLAAQEYYINIPNSFERELKGVSRKESANRILTMAHHTPDNKTIEGFMDLKNSIYLDLIKNFKESNRLEGVEEIFELANEKKLKKALVSASTNAPILLNVLNMQTWFDVIVNPQNQPSKPAPDIFLAAANDLNVNPSECIGFEDSIAGLKSIQAAGMTSVGIGSQDLDADFNYPTLKDAAIGLSQIL